MTSLVGSLRSSIFIGTVIYGSFSHYYLLLVVHWPPTLLRTFSHSHVPLGRYSQTLSPPASTISRFHKGEHSSSQSKHRMGKLRIWASHHPWKCLRLLRKACQIFALWRFEDIGPDLLPHPLSIPRQATPRYITSYESIQSDASGNNNTPIVNQIANKLDLRHHLYNAVHNAEPYVITPRHTMQN